MELFPGLRIGCLNSWSTFLLLVLKGYFEHETIGYIKW